MIDTSFLSQLDRFALVIKKRVTSSFIGQRKSTAAGRGMMYKDYRIYAPGDDIKSIDWKVYARTDNLYVKTFEEEKNLLLHVIVDGSSSMNFGKPSKFDFASMLGVGFAYLAMKDNEKFQFSTFADSLEMFQPKRGMGQLMAMIGYLNELKNKGFSRLKDAVLQYKKTLGSKGMFILISDFLIPFEEIKESLLMLGSHEIKVIQVLDPLEKDLNLQGDFMLKDSESGEKMRVFLSQRLRYRYQGLLDEHTAKIEQVCNELGIKFYFFTTDIPIFDAFYKLLE
ncbi:DUF58 domain-containing protein [Candidatus Woesearchaeota archaeon]|nr:DUF58 domain-containing protein [Candidatus Woesearchaeota archaeon]